MSHDVTASGYSTVFNPRPIAAKGRLENSAPARRKEQIHRNSLLPNYRDFLSPERWFPSVRDTSDKSRFTGVIAAITKVSATSVNAMKRRLPGPVSGTESDAPNEKDRLLRSRARAQEGRVAHARTRCLRLRSAACIPRGASAKQQRTLAHRRLLTACRRQIDCDTIRISIECVAGARNELLMIACALPNKLD